MGALYAGSTHTFVGLVTLVFQCTAMCTALECPCVCISWKGRLACASTLTTEGSMCRHKLHTSKEHEFALRSKTQARSTTVMTGNTEKETMWGMIFSRQQHLSFR